MPRKRLANRKKNQARPLSGRAIYLLLRYQDELRHGDVLVIEGHHLVVEDTCDNPMCNGACLVPELSQKAG